jgi:hypothetical protein
MLWTTSSADGLKLLMGNNGSPDASPIQRIRVSGMRCLRFEFASAALRLGLAISAGCASDADLPKTGSLASGTSLGNAAVERATRVATTAACAQAYGLAVDPTRLRAAYLTYETNHGTPRAQLATIGDSYDSAYQRASMACPSSDAADVRADLLRYQAGYFTPRTPPPPPAFDVPTVWGMQD